MKKLIGHLAANVNHVFDGLTKELSENRALLNWVYAIAYLALIFYCAVTNKDAQTAAIYATAGIIGTIFASWVIGASYEKVQQMHCNMASTAAPAKPLTDKEQEETAGD